MARNRQRAKERQARRKAKDEGHADESSQPGDGESGPPAPKPPPAPTPPRADALPSEPKASEPEARANGREEEPLVDAHLRAGAPPEDVGRSDEVLEYEQDIDSADGDEHFDSAEDFPEEDLAPGPRARRGAAEEHTHRPRFVQFLFAVWAELQRVQWPDRQALTTLTGVVLGFVLIAGGYLGLLDAIFSRIIQAIL